MTGKNLEERHDIHGRPYYWTHWLDKDTARQEDSDIARLMEGYVTLTPLCLDLTDYRMMERLRECVGERARHPGESQDLMRHTEKDPESSSG